MKKHFLLAGLLALIVTSCNKHVDKTVQPDEQLQYNEMDTTAVRMLTTAAV